MMFFHPILLLTALVPARQVLGHGFVEWVSVAGKVYKGFLPFEGLPSVPTKTVIRQIHNISPIQKIETDPELACGPQAKKVDLVADANPGDDFTFGWVGLYNTTTWIHKVGPILTYMTSCGDTPCNDFDVTGAKWFKISEIVKNPKGVWYQEELNRGVDPIPTTVQIPSTLAAGNYIIRQEIIALHNGIEKGSTEIFPSCTQLRVGGTQEGKPTADELVSIPGVYTLDEPGIWPGKDLYETGFQYTVPGPPVAKLGGNGSDSPDSSNPSKGESSSTSSATVSRPPTSSATAASTAIEGVATPCKLDLAAHATPPLQATAKRSNSQHPSPAQLSSRHSLRARDYRSRLH